MYCVNLHSHNTIALVVRLTNVLLCGSFRIFGNGGRSGLRARQIVRMDNLRTH
jgi:hypothetical protein